MKTKLKLISAKTEASVWAWLSLAIFTPGGIRNYIHLNSKIYILCVDMRVTDSKHLYIMSDLSNRSTFNYVFNSFSNLIFSEIAFCIYRVKSGP